MMVEEEDRAKYQQHEQRPDGLSGTPRERTELPLKGEIDGILHYVYSVLFAPLSNFDNAFNANTDYQ